MQPRMKSPVMVIPEAMQAMLALGRSAKNAGVPAPTFHLMFLRASQINGCSFCVDMHSRDLKKIGESDERIFGVAAWYDSPFFTAPERAALALTESATRLSDRTDPIPDEIWNEATKHFDEKALASLVIAITAINAWNRINVTTRQMPPPR